MAAVTFYLDMRTTKKDGTHAIKLRVAHRGAFLLRTPFYATEREWAGQQYSSKAENYRARNMALRNLINKVELHLFTMPPEKLSAMSDKVLRAQIEDLLELRPRTSAEVVTFLQRAAVGKSDRTQALFKWTIDKVKAYDAGALVGDVTDKWLAGFAEALRSDGFHENSIHRLVAYVMRAVNVAVQQGALSQRPFAGFKVSLKPTRKRNLSVEALRALRDMPLDGRRAFARDMFMLSFYLMGMNFSDMYTLRKSDIRDGRVEYERHKTGTLYSVKIFPEAAEIMERWRQKDGDRLLDCKEYATGGTFCTSTTRMLGMIHKGLTTYYARHTWASLAAEIDTPIETISHALGHKIGSPITAIYINYSQKKVDEANRRVIAYLNADR